MLCATPPGCWARVACLTAEQVIQLTPNTHLAGAASRSTGLAWGCRTDQREAQQDVQR